MRSPWHAYEAQVQRAVMGEEKAQDYAQKKAQNIRSYLTEQHKDFYVHLPLLYVSVLDSTGHPVALVLTGEPGFVHSLSDTAASIQPMQTLNPDLFASGSQIGILGLESHTRRRNRLNGTVQSLDPSTNTLTLAVRQAFGNCPKYIANRKLQLKITDPRHLLWPDYIGNFFFQTLGNLAANGQAGLLFIDYSDGSVLHVKGHAKLDMHDTSLPGAQRAVKMTIEAWHCTPQRLPLEQVGPTDASPYNPKSGQTAADQRFVSCKSIEQVAEGIKSFTFHYPERIAGARQPFDYLSGQYASFDFQLEGKDHNRTWTISSHPDESRETQSFTISVKKAGLISSWLHDNLKPGSVIEWRGALGDFTPIAGDKPVLLVAGGIGITPMRSFLITFSKERRPVTLLYSVRAAREAAFLDELHGIAESSGGKAKVVVNVTGKDDTWHGPKGRLNAEHISEQVPNLKDHSDVYMCGPQPFMNGVESTLTSLGFPQGSIHSESFSF
ncbi:hypothetical protein WJX73_008896 [Symbiochloris irregularis]|uniref:FAD-binding FR-type domain-containing protein n=1 Tax=Symbiochloris irregularis TaxID=706552 RepID=A0AAW1Q2Z6_9CHLO